MYAGPYIKSNVCLPPIKTRVQEAKEINPDTPYLTALMDGKHFLYVYQ